MLNSFKICSKLIKIQSKLDLITIKDNNQLYELQISLANIVKKWSK